MWNILLVNFLPDIDFNDYPDENHTQMFAFEKSLFPPQILGESGKNLQQRTGRIE